MSMVWTIVAFLFFLSVLVIAVMAVHARRTGKPVWPLLAFVLGGSLLLGGLYLVIALLVPGRGAWNLIWMLGLPAGLAVLRRPRIPSLALAIPILFGGWMSFTLIAWTLQLPLYD